MESCNENCIEWLNGSDTITVTLSQRRFINKVRRLAEKHEKSVEIVAENADGSIVAHLPIKALKLSIYNQSKTVSSGVLSNLRRGKDDTEISEDLP